MSEGYKFQPSSPAEKPVDSEFTPGAEVISGLATSFGLEKSATEAEVAKAFLGSRAFSEGPRQGQDGDPIDLFPTGASDRAVLDWAEKASEERKAA